MQYEQIAGNLALDFVATVSKRTTTGEDFLAVGADLTDWIARAGIVDEPVPVSAAELEAAKELREALYRLTVAITTGQPVPASDVKIVNAAAAAPPPSLRLRVPDRTGEPRNRRNDERSSDARYDVAQLRRCGDLPAVLSAIARSAIELLASTDRDLITWCAGTTCTRPFLDRSRGRRRRWCDMASCGDRVKAASYRRRRRDLGGRAAG